MKIGFIGLGIMGRPMALNLIKKGHQVYVSNTSNKKDELVQAGALAGDYKFICNNSELIITMLPNSPEVKDVMLNDNGVKKYLRKGQVYIDTSSINPLCSKEVAKELEKLGVEMLDAPVSGGEPKAIDGTLSFMVGGKKEIFDKYKDILSCMGSSVVYCGEVGAGNTTKLANQVIVAANIAAVAEGFTLAKKAGIDPKTVFEAIKGGLAGSTVMNAKGPMMLENNTKPGFRIDLHIKDLNNALNVGRSLDSPMVLSEELIKILNYLHENGYGDCDHSAIAKYYEIVSGEKLYK